MKPALIRAARTFVQTFIGVFLAGLIGAGTGVLDLEAFANLTLLSQAAAAGVVAVLSFIQNWLESTQNVSYDRG